MQPIINHYWTRARFPHELLPGLAELGIAGLPYTGYGCPGKSPLLDGMVAMELARTDPSIATFFGVHGAGDGLHLPVRVRGAEATLAAAHGPHGEARRLRAHRTGGRLGGVPRPGHQRPPRRRRLGAGWTQEVDRQRQLRRPDRDLGQGHRGRPGQGLPGRGRNTGFTTENLEDKIALRVVQNALITLEGVRVPETNRLQAATSFRDTAEVLKMTRAGVAWMAVGCARGAYEHALAYACEREQFGRLIGGFQLVQDLLVRMLGNITASASLCARLSQLQAAGLARDEHASAPKRSAPCACARRSAGPGTAGRQRHPARAPRRPLRRRRRGHLLLRGHPRDQHPDRRPRDHRPQRLRLNQSQPLSFEPAVTARG